MTAGRLAGSLLVASLWLGVGAPARSQDAACAPHAFRFEEDCHGLAGERLSGTDRLRYLPLGADGELWLTIGGEYRAKAETLDVPNFGVSPADHAYLARGQRFELDGDLHSTTGLRLFVQLSSGLETGRKPAERPFDRSDPDLAQAFVELPLAMLGAPTTLRLGRQELDLGGNRLVSVRDPANLRRAFDMVRVETRPFGAEFVGFWGRPLVNRPGAFDDGAPNSETFYGATLRLRPRVAAAPTTLDLFWFGRDRDKAVFEDAAGRDRRRVVGLRLSGRWKAAAWGATDVAVQAAYQYGRVGAADVSAYGMAVDLGWSWAQAPLTPRLGLNLGLASGDRRRGDSRLNTYDPLYPNLGYFTDAPEAYPSNFRDVQPSLTLHPLPSVDLKLGVDLIFRDSLADAVYASNGAAFLAGTGAGGRFVTALSFLNATWRATRHIQLTGAYVRGSTGSVLSEAGGRPLNYGLLQSAYRF